LQEEDGEEDDEGEQDEAARMKTRRLRMKEEDDEKWRTESLHEDKFEKV
jgi:hypothetical protein